MDSEHAVPDATLIFTQCRLSLYVAASRSGAVVACSAVMVGTRRILYSYNAVIQESDRSLRRGLLLLLLLLRTRLTQAVRWRHVPH